MAGVRPHFSARMRGRQRIDRHVQDFWYFRRAPLAFDAITDGYLFRPQVFADERGQLRNRPSRCSGKDRTECLSLVVVGALIDIGGHRPISFGHRSWRVDCERHVEAIERHVVIAPYLDMNDEGYVANTLRWSRG